MCMLPIRKIFFIFSRSVNEEHIGRHMFLFITMFYYVLLEFSIYYMSCQHIRLEVYIIIMDRMCNTISRAEGE